MVANAKQPESICRRGAYCTRTVLIDATVTYCTVHCTDSPVRAVTGGGVGGSSPNAQLAVACGTTTSVRRTGARRTAYGYGDDYGYAYGLRVTGYAYGGLFPSLWPRFVATATHFVCYSTVLYTPAIQHPLELSTRLEHCCCLSRFSSH